MLHALAGTISLGIKQYGAELEGGIVSNTELTVRGDAAGCGVGNITVYNRQQVENLLPTCGVTSQPAIFSPFLQGRVPRLLRATWVRSDAGNEVFTIQLYGFAIHFTGIGHHNAPAISHRPLQFIQQVERLQRSQGGDVHLIQALPKPWVTACIAETIRLSVVSTAGGCQGICARA